MDEKRVMVIGGGIAGLTAAWELASAGIAVDVCERSDFAGGQGIRLSCKATDACVKCGACLADDRLGKVTAHPRIRLMTGARIEALPGKGAFSFQIRHKPRFIDPSRCTDCGLCHRICPVEGALVQGTSGFHRPFYAVSESRCLYLKDQSCTLCQEKCPTKAVHLDAAWRTETIKAHAVIVSVGFSLYLPRDKPYGYGLFKNVVTHRELEAGVKRHGRVLRPSDHAEPRRIAFIQCVGSRDAKRGHLWCSTYCCGASLRMARRIAHQQPRTQTTLFYIDIQTFGRSFPAFYHEIRESIRMVRAIPADIYPSGDGALKLTFWDEKTGKTRQEEFDLVVLATAMIPPDSLEALSQGLPLERTQEGFLSSDTGAGKGGVFAAGAATGPMPLAEAMASGAQAAWEAIRYLNSKGRAPKT